jgi:hypothetical protein
MEASTGFLHEVTPNWLSSIATKRDSPLDFKDARPEFAGSRWQDRIVPAASLDYDAFDRRYVVNEALMPAFPVRLPRANRIRAVVPQVLRPRSVGSDAKHCSRFSAYGQDARSDYRELKGEARQRELLSHSGVDQPSC